ncbi:hypothetical protein NPIL_243541 [Nephila pilipes]|uniref:Uncharacterized protein n=1 Tax=Nephila pilipes TaxID=299642 RepID=A0A8X6U3W6_NEPPI|nr:hypothetical protein NPIL_243541 [Nephila pilipes]
MGSTSKSICNYFLDVCYSPGHRKQNRIHILSQSLSRKTSPYIRRYPAEGPYLQLGPPLWGHGVPTERVLELRDCC